MAFFRESMWLKVVLALLIPGLEVLGKTYHGYKVLRVATKNAAEEKFIFNLSERLGSDVDLWTEDSSARYADILVSPELQPHIKRAFRQHGLHYETIIHDVQKLIDSSMPSRRKKRALLGPYSANNFSYTQYHTYEEILQWMKNFAKANPSVVKLFNVTNSYEGRDVMGVKIGTRGFWKPSIWIDSGLHAREWIAPATAVYVAQYLVKHYKTHAEIRSLLRKFDFYILPVANPDGYEHSWNEDRLWRKTKSIHKEHMRKAMLRNFEWSGEVERCSIGVDANRNFGYHWGEAGANVNDPCSNVYAGPYAFSEPETKGMKNFIEWEIPRLKLYLSFHSYGQLWLGAWGYASDRPKNFNAQRNAADAAIRAIMNAGRKNYTFGTIANLMYPASGTSIDYFHSTGVPYAFAVELRPEENEPTLGFLYPSKYIEPTGKEIVHGLLAISKHIRAVEKL